ncbi:MAG: DNA-directed RNA polymerase subunit alpha [Candidatus Sungiibacteriota bacterium]
MISLPLKPEIVEEQGNRAVIEVAGLYPGYGHTIGNSMRRVMLSSLKGAAITSIKIEAAGHEFTTLEGVVEDIVDLTLNIKQLRFLLHDDGPHTISLTITGEREITGKDFTMPSQVELMTPALHIATLTAKKARLAIEGTVESGRGYVPVEARSKDKVEVGTIALDAAFSPVRHVNYEVRNMRVGDRTDYHLLRFIIETDGSISPRNAFMAAAEILTDQFAALRDGFSEPVLVVSNKKGQAIPSFDESETPDAQSDAAKMKLDDIKLSSRTLNALREAGIKTVAGLSRKRASALGEIGGIGEKGIQEIRKALGNLGITLKP